MSFQACAEIVKRGDPDRFLATMAAPPKARKLLFPLYAFNVEVARAPWITQESVIAEMRLQWWRDALDEIRHAKPVRRHEVVTPLAGLIDPESAEILDRLVQARRWDIYKDPFENQARFSEYLDATAAGLLWVTCRALGVSEQQSEIRCIGFASGLANWFLAVPQLKAQGRIPLIDQQLQTVVDLARTGLEKLKITKALPENTRAAILSTWRAKHLLNKVVKNPELVLNGQLVQSEFSRRGTLLWQSNFRR